MLADKVHTIVSQSNLSTFISGGGSSADFTHQGQLTSHRGLESESV